VRRRPRARDPITRSPSCPLQTSTTLQQTPLRATRTDAAAQSGREYVTSLVQMDSFEGKRLRAWYTVPKDPVPGGRLPAVLVVPGYGGDKPIPTHLRSHREAPAFATIEQALAMARELNDQSCEALCLATRAYIRSAAYGQLVETTCDAEEALRLAREIGDPKLLAEALVSLGRVLQWRAVFDRSLEYLHEGIELARHTHAGLQFGMAAYILGNADTAAGAYEDALQWYQEISDYAHLRSALGKRVR